MPSNSWRIRLFGALGLSGSFPERLAPIAYRNHTDFNGNLSQYFRFLFKQISDQHTHPDMLPSQQIRESEYFVVLQPTK